MYKSRIGFNFIYLGHVHVAYTKIADMPVTCVTDVYSISTQLQLKQFTLSCMLSIWYFSFKQETKSAD